MLLIEISCCSLNLADYARTVQPFGGWRKNQNANEIADRAGALTSLWRLLMILSEKVLHRRDTKKF